MSRVVGVVALVLWGIPARKSVSTRAILISQWLIRLSWRCRERAARPKMPEGFDLHSSVSGAWILRVVSSVGRAGDS